MNVLICQFVVICVPEHKDFNILVGAYVHVYHNNTFKVEFKMSVDDGLNIIFFFLTSCLHPFVRNSYLLVVLY